MALTEFESVLAALHGIEAKVARIEDALTSFKEMREVLVNANNQQTQRTLTLIDDHEKRLRMIESRLWMGIGAVSLVTFLSPLVWRLVGSQFGF